MKKTYAATLYATYRQDVTAEAETPQEAKWLMLNSFSLNLAECVGETDIEEFREIAGAEPAERTA